MITLKRFSFMLALVLCALSINASAQAPSIEVTTDEEAAQFSTQGKAQSVRVEVFAPSGELVFEGDGLEGQAVAWQMRNQKGERVADGVYVAAITVTDFSGKRRKRIEQITVSSEPLQVTAPGVDSFAPQDPLAPTGAGTAGKLAKWTTATNLGNSVITESVTGKIGVNAAVPAASFQVNGLQPAPLASNGTNTATLLQTSGGKGGNTTVGGGKTGGKGASISLVSGNGGNAVAGSFNGSGGNITLQPGSAGTGGGFGGSGNVFIIPVGDGAVGIGTNNPPDLAKLQVEGGGRDTAINGTNVDGDGVRGTSGLYNGVFGISFNGTGVLGSSTNGKAGRFEGDVEITKNLIFGSQTRQMLNLFGTSYGIGVQASTQYFRTSLHFAWYKGGTHNDASLNPGGGVRLMYLNSAGNLNVLGNVCADNVPCASDARLKQNITNLGYGLGQVLRLRPVSWHWKSEPEGALQLGLVAQEVETVMPELVMREADAAKPLGLNYMALLPVAVKAIQEQQAQIQQQQKLIGQQAQRNEEQALQIKQLQAQLNQVRRIIRRRGAKR